MTCCTLVTLQSNMIKQKKIPLILVTFPLNVGWKKCNDTEWFSVILRQKITIALKMHFNWQFTMNCTGRSAVNHASKLDQTASNRNIISHVTWASFIIGAECRLLVGRLCWPWVISWWLKVVCKWLDVVEGNNLVNLEKIKWHLRTAKS